MKNVERTLFLRRTSSTSAVLPAAAPESKVKVTRGLRASALTINGARGPVAAGVILGATDVDFGTVVGGGVGVAVLV